MKSSSRLILASVLFLILSVGFALSFPQPASAAAINVDTTADNVADDNLCSLREAIDNANDDDATHDDCEAGTGADLIILPAGEYTLTEIGDPYDDLNASGDLDVYGELIILGAGLPNTIIQAGTESPADNQCTNCIDRVFDVFSNGDLTLNNLTVRHGEPPNGTSTISGKSGGGIYNQGTLTLNNCFVTENKAGDGYDPPNGNGGPPGNGGGINNSGTLLLSNSWIYGNEAGKGGDGEAGGIGSFGGRGGGIYTSSDTLIINSIIHQNDARDGGRGGDNGDDDGGMGGDGGHGGGLYCAYCRLTILNSTISSNDSGRGGPGGDVIGSGPGSGGNGGRGGYGGGMAIFGAEADAHLRSCTVKYNVAELGGGKGDDPAGSMTFPSGTDGQRGLGGGAYIQSAQASITGSTFNNNEAYNGGGISITNDGHIVANNSTFSANNADYYGGGLHGNDGGLIELIFTTVTANIADINLDGSGTGGGISTSDVFTLTNTILAGNFDWSPNGNPDCRGDLHSSGFNILGSDGPSCIDSLVGSDLVGVNPLLSPLDNNGGPTQTHAINDSSPAWNQIPNYSNGCISGLTRDQRFVVRFANCDIGAYEFDQASHLYLPLVVR
jgi:CSLREA domain-containing protein